MTVMAASAVLAASASMSWAGAGGKGGIPINARPISLDEFKARCANPDSFDVQRAPQNIRVECSETAREFIAAAPGEVPLPGSRAVTTLVMSDKFYVNADESDVPVVSKGGSCLRFKEVERTLAVERPLSCGEILGMKGSMDDLCVSMLNAAKGANPKIVDVHETGTVIDTCGSIVK